MSVGALACTSYTNTDNGAQANASPTPSVAMTIEPSPTPNTTVIENEPPKMGTLTGESVLTEEVGVIYMVVKLDDGRQKAIPINDPRTGEPIPEGTRVEVRPAKDAKHGEWELVRIVKAGK